MQKLDISGGIFFFFFVDSDSLMNHVYAVCKTLHCIFILFPVKVYVN